MGIEIRVLEMIECVINTRKWVGILTRNLVKLTVVNA
jgi:hypothetical protein